LPVSNSIIPVFSLVYSQAQLHAPVFSLDPDYLYYHTTTTTTTTTMQK